MEERKSRYHRLTEWWRPKAGAIFSLLLFYLAMWNVPFAEGWKLLAYSFVTLTGFGFTGYFLNDWADIPFDRKVGKTNLVAGIPKIARPFLLIALLAIALFPWLVYFKADEVTIGLIGAQLILQFAYPIPPIRIKNHPIPAMITDALYAFVIPAVLAWHTFDLTSGFNDNQGQVAHLLFLVIWMLALGVRHIINHHVEDKHNDLRTDTPNLANSVNPIVLRGFIQRVLFPLEILSCISFFAALFAYAGFLPLLAIVLIAIFGSRHLIGVPPFVSVSFSKTRLDRFTSFYLGILGLVFLVLYEMEYALFLVLFLLLFTDILSHPLKKIFLENTGYILWTAPKKIASLTVNWSVYYFRKYLLGWSEERNFGIHYPDRVVEMAVRDKKKQGIVAIFNQNQSKYTETFVRGHVENLPFHTVFFHGWPAPIFVNDMENVFASNDFFLKLRYNVAHFLNIDSQEIENRSIVSRLVQENVDIILAEFGTMGARLVPIAEEVGVPIVPIFYGYDAWHSKALKENHTAYQSLFQSAPLVLGVSKDICGQLINLGCPAEKVEYLPCYVDLTHFQYVERSFSQPNFLAIGRFCETKAPFLTILAFSKVVKQIPDATLTMIGGDENGVLETCMTLIRSLSLEESIVLPGALTSTQVHEQMLKASIFVQHSLTTPQTGDKEGTPVAIMEAMATGLPVISTKHAGIAEIIENEVSGVLVDEFDHEAMANAMIELIKDTNRMKQIGIAASKAIYSNKSLTNHIGELSLKLEKHIKR